MAIFQPCFMSDTRDMKAIFGITAYSIFAVNGICFFYCIKTKEERQKNRYTLPVDGLKVRPNSEVKTRQTRK